MNEHEKLDETLKELKDALEEYELDDYSENAGDYVGIPPLTVAHAIKLLKTQESRKLTLEEVISRKSCPVYLKANLTNKYECWALVSGEIAGRVVFTLVGEPNGNPNMIYLLKKEYGIKWECWTDGMKEW